MGRSLKRRRTSDEARDPARDLWQDRLRGLVLGALIGEALGSTVAGLTRDTILRRHGRVVQMLPGARGGPVAVAVETWLDRVARGTTPADAARALDDRGLPAVTMALGIAASALAGDRPPTSGGDPAGDPVDSAHHGTAVALLACATRHAIGCSPYARLPADRILSGQAMGLDRDRHRELEDALEALRAQVMAPPSPRDARRPFAALEAPLRLALLVLHSLLVRPRSSEEAMVYAANLGEEEGDATSGDGAPGRAALVGMIAGVHRGLACLPERWIHGLVEARPTLVRIEPAIADIARRGNPGAVALVSR